MARQVILATETTGLDPAQGHRVIEIACVEMVNRRLTRNNFYKRIHPGREIDAGATQVHGITLEDLENEPKFADIAEEFLAYASGAELIIHNAPFDVGFLNAELARLKKERIEGEKRVSLLRADRMDPDMLDERVRYQLEYAHPRDLVVKINRPN